MQIQSAPTMKTTLPTALVLMVLGWGGLVLSYILTSGPDAPARWLFYFCAVVALTGTALPLATFLNLRFPSKPPPTSWVVLRQALWAGIYLPILMGLQQYHVISWLLALLLAAGLILIEWLLRLRERSQWKP